MFNIFTNLILVGCSNDFGLNSSQVDPSVEDLTEDAPAEAVNTCECPDNSAEITALQEELRSILDRVGTLESEPEPVPEVPSSALVVTEYEVDCGAPTKMFDLLAFDGAYYPMNYIDDWSQLSNSVYPRGCVLAKVDPLDPPWFIQQISVYDSRRGLSSTGGGGYEDPYALYGNPWFYNWVGGTGTPVRVHEDGYVLYSSSFEWDCSSGTFDADGDCPVEMPVVRVVIIDDKPALRPEAW
jgi:hypothetical protein